jgi:hypothetical protein
MESSLMEKMLTVLGAWSGADFDVLPLAISDRGPLPLEGKRRIGVWQGVAMDSLKFQPGQPCFTLIRPAGETPLKGPCGRFRGGPPTLWAACGLLLPLWTPHAICLRLQGYRSGCDCGVSDEKLLWLLLDHYTKRVKPPQESLCRTFFA